MGLTSDSHHAECNNLMFHLAIYGEIQTISADSEYTVLLLFEEQIHQ